MWDRLLKALERREEGWLLLDITREESWKMEIHIHEKGEEPDIFGKQGGLANRFKAPERMLEAGGQGVLWEEGGRTCFIQPIGLAGRVQRSWFWCFPMWAFPAW